MTADEINGIDNVERLMATDADLYGSPFKSFVPAPTRARPIEGGVATTETKAALGSAVPRSAAAGRSAAAPIPAAPSSDGRRQTEHSHYQIPGTTRTR